MKSKITILGILLCFSSFSQTDIIISSQDIYLPVKFNDDGTKLFCDGFGSSCIVWEDGQETMYPHQYTYDISFDSQRIITEGIRTQDGVDYEVAAFYDYQNNQLITSDFANEITPTPSNTSYSSAWGISSDGNLIVGMILDQQYNGRPFLWDITANTYQFLNLGSFTSGRANGMSDINNLYFGHVVSSNGSWVPSIWHNTTLIHNETQSGDFYCASRDGNYIAGNLLNEILIWQPDGTRELLNFDNTDWDALGFNNTNNSTLVPTSITNDKVIYGYKSSFPPLTREAFIYTDASGVHRLNELLEANGISGFENANFFSTIASANNGYRIAGTVRYGELSYTYIFDLTTLNNDAPNNNAFSSFVYPTQTADVVNIVLSNNLKEYTINIYDTLGKLLQTNKTNSLRSEVTLDMYENGVYLIEILTDSSRKTYKIVKK